MYEVWGEGGGTHTMGGGGVATRDTEPYIYIYCNAATIGHLLFLVEIALVTTCRLCKIKFSSSGSKRNRDHQPKHPLASLTIACALTKPTTATMTIDDHTKADTPITYHDLPLPPGQAIYICHTVTCSHALEAIAHGTIHAVLAKNKSDRGIHHHTSTIIHSYPRNKFGKHHKKHFDKYEFVKCMSSGQCHNIVDAG